MNIIYKSKCDEKMSIKCILPNVNFCGVRRRQRKIDDRPFPEDDYKVFPRENLYDRIVLPGKFYQFVNFNEGDIYMSIIFLRNHKVLQSVFTGLLRPLYPDLKPPTAPRPGLRGQG